jgi:hypothetical protein
MSDTAEIQAEDTSEEAINAVVDATSVLPAASEEPAMSPQVLWAFCTDVAQNIHTYTQIALRYGFVDTDDLKRFLVKQVAVRKRIKELRAVWESDDNVENRIRTLAGHSVLTALPETARIMFNPRNPDNTKLDALKHHATIAGVFAPPRTSHNDGVGGPAAGRFSVNIVFSNAGRTETITTIDSTATQEDAPS